MSFFYASQESFLHSISAHCEARMVRPELAQAREDLDVSLYDDIAGIKIGDVKFRFAKYHLL